MDTKRQYTYEQPRPAVTVDCVIFGLGSDHVLRLLLIRRGKEPFRGRWALPGGFVQVSEDGSQGEGLEEAARRELEEETGARIIHLEPLATFGAPGRDPRGRVISVAFTALVRAADHVVAGGDDAAEAAWMPVHQLPGSLLAFDHSEIVRVGIARLEAKVRAPVGSDLRPPTFTPTELHSLCAALLALRP
jgi:8-oxo-dGTP diphosphatase